MTKNKEEHKSQQKEQPNENKSDIFILNPIRQSDATQEKPLDVKKLHHRCCYERTW